VDHDPALAAAPGRRALSQLSDDVTVSPSVLDMSGAALVGEHDRRRIENTHAISRCQVA
jgi:hypothetical protein